MTIARIFYRKFSKFLSGKGVFITKSLSYKKQSQALPPNLDYIRYSTLGLCYEEIYKNEVAGNVAEVGVYKGDFAMRLNLLFKDRSLYLFDTFEGFADSDADNDISKGYSTGDQDFSNTSLLHVKQRMPYPEQCIFKKGIFPVTARGIEDKFCFVSLDADLYAPIFAGLQFFYPKLSKGGYIFIHDFNNDEYKGAREAVQQYCAEEKISYVPIPDSGGTVIITK